MRDRLADHLDRIEAGREQLDGRSIRLHGQGAPSAVSLISLAIATWCHRTPAATVLAWVYTRAWDYPWADGHHRAALADAITTALHQQLATPGIGWEQAADLCRATTSTPMVVSWSLGDGAFPAEHLAEAAGLWHPPDEDHKAEDGEAGDDGGWESAWDRLGRTRRWELATDALRRHRDHPRQWTPAWRLRAPHLHDLIDIATDLHTIHDSDSR